MGEGPSWDRTMQLLWDKAIVDGRRPHGGGPIMGQGLDIHMG